MKNGDAVLHPDDGEIGGSLGRKRPCLLLLEWDAHEIRRFPWRKERA